MSISLSRVRVTASPSAARASVPSKVTISLTRADWPEPATSTASPGAIEPETTVPEKPRNSPFGRLTHWTGRRNGRSLLPPVTSTEWRCSSKVGPWYHGVRNDRSVTLSPDRAAIGMTRTDGLPIPAAKAEKSVAISSKQCASNPRRSILLMASTMWRMPSSELIKACRLVCGSTPLRASTRITASSQVEAPVAMLRVYCSWPGVSATANARSRVAKNR
jgi:hypothetical protein